MLVQGFESLKAAEDVTVDILEISQGRDLKVEAKEDPDATEYSSSFADTISGNENGSSLSDAEVESQFISDIDLAPAFDGFGSVFPIRFALIYLCTALDGFGSIFPNAFFCFDNICLLEVCLEENEASFTQNVSLQSNVLVIIAYSMNLHALLVLFCPLGEIIRCTYLIIDQVFKLQPCNCF